jgi:hypothetical protein
MVYRPSVDEVQQALALLVDEPLAPDRDRDDLAPRGVEGLLHQVVGRVLARADEQAGRE